MKPLLVQDDNALADICTRASGSPWFALDTEFMREQTYYAKLCLIQIATPEAIALIDPLAVDNLDPLLELLYAPGTVKVLHSARQDLELFFDRRQAVPGPVFDTQIAAGFLGYDEQVGYSTLVEILTGVRLDKTQTRTDWAMRPLRPEQLHYAGEDVRHLRDVYLKLRDDLAAQGRLQWAEEECARLTRPELYANSLATIHLRIKQGHLFPPPVQHVLRALTVWREQTAQRRNLPRGWIARDADLIAIAKEAPREPAAVERLSPGLRRWAREIVEVVSESAGEGEREHWDAPPQFTPAQAKLLKRLGGIVRARAEERKIGPGLLATRKDLERLVAGDTTLPVLQGWREELVGRELLAQIKAGV